MNVIFIYVYNNKVDKHHDKHRTKKPFNKIIIIIIVSITVADGAIGIYAMLNQNTAAGQDKEDPTSKHILKI